MNKIGFGTWEKTNCYECGDHFQVTRTNPKEYEKEEDIVCGECEIRKDSYERGFKAGQKSILTGTREITIQVHNTELHALEDILVVDYQGNSDKYAEDRSKCLDLLGKIKKQFDKK